MRQDLAGYFGSRGRQFPQYGRIDDISIGHVSFLLLASVSTQISGHTSRLLCQSVGRLRLTEPQALFWSAVINGVVAVPVMVLMMLLTANTKVMGQFTVTGVLRFTGWLATAVMAAAVVGMLITAAM
jgi:hypothetical protein